MADNKRSGFMGNVTVGEKGQIVIPKAARDMLGIKPGDTLLLIAHPDSGIGIPPADQVELIRRKVTAAMLSNLEGEK